MALRIRNRHFPQDFVGFRIDRNNFAGPDHAAYRITAIRCYEGIMHAASGFNVGDDLMAVHVNDLNQRFRNNGNVDFSARMLAERL